MKLTYIVICCIASATVITTTIKTAFNVKEDNELHIAATIKKPFTESTEDEINIESDLNKLQTKTFKPVSDNLRGSIPINPKSKQLQAFERRAEIYYDHQRDERQVIFFGNQLVRINPNFACVRGINPLGLDTLDSAVDGHKFGCGIHKISGTPIVYSFGSRNIQDFELGILEIRPDAAIFTYDIDEKNLPGSADKIKGVTYKARGLGCTRSDSGKWLKCLEELMQENGHTYIDVLKVDIEQWEWVWIKKELEVLDKVGQCLIELHMKPISIFNLWGYWMNKEDTAVHFVEQVESRGLRLFFRELNAVDVTYVRTHTELSFIQKDWGEWDANKMTAFIHH